MTTARRGGPGREQTVREQLMPVQLMYVGGQWRKGGGGTDT